MKHKWNADPKEMNAFVKQEVKRICKKHNINREVYVSYITYSNSTTKEQAEHFIEVDGIEISEGFFMGTDALKVLGRFKKWAKENGSSD